MALEDLKKKIYRPGAEFGERIKRPELFDPEKEIKKHKEDWDPKKKGFKLKLTPSQKSKLIKAAIGLGVILIIVAFLAIWSGLTSFDKSKVEIEISGPEKASSGEELTYTVKYFNGTKVDLQQAQITFYFPEGSVPSDTIEYNYTTDVPDIEPQEEVRTEFKVRLVGTKQEEQELKAKLQYKPKNFNARFDNEASITTKIIAVPLDLDFDLPAQLVSGQVFDFSLEYLNEADIAFEDLMVKIEYPQGFTFLSSIPQADERDNIWRLDRLKQGEQKEIFIEGSIQGTEGESKSFMAQIGLEKNGKFIPYSEKKEATQIAVSPLHVSQQVNGTVEYIAEAGDRLDYRINYKNTTGIGINDVVLTASLEGKAFDINTLNVQSGSFDGINQKIVWKTSNIPELEHLGPGENGFVEFSIGVKNPLPAGSYTDKNFVLETEATIDSLKPPLALKDIQLKGESHLEVKVVSQIFVDTKGFFNDDLFSNSGPIPPKVNNKTTYTLKFELSNTSNDIKDVIVAAYLPPHVQWEGKTKPDGSDISFNEQTGKIEWDVGFMTAMSPVKWVAFQVSFTPAIVHEGSRVDLIGEAKVTGQDMFTGLELSDEDEQINTELPDDATISRLDGTVVK